MNTCETLGPFSHLQGGPFGVRYATAVGPLV